MADPTKYTPGYDFANYQATLPNKPLPGQRVDVELADIAQSLDETIDALADVRRADGKLQNGSVIADSLSATLIDDIAADVLAALGPEAEAAIQEALPQWRGAWLTATAYAVNDLAREAGSTYICLVAHTAGTFSTDLAAAKWAMFAQQGAAGAGTGDMLAANNLSDLASAVTARTNLGVAAATDTLLKAGNLSGLADAATARTNLGVAASSDTLLKAGNLSGLADAAAARTNLGATTVGDAVITAASAAAARTAIGAVIGTDVQAYAAILSALAALASNGVIARTGAGALAARTLTAGTGISISNGDGVAGNPVISNTLTVEPTVLLGTLATTSGTSVTLSSLVLTDYKFLKVVFRAVSTSDAASNLQIAGDECSAPLGNAGNRFHGIADIDLSDGTWAAMIGVNAGATGSASGTVYGGNSGYTTATTSVVFSIDVGTFDAGSILVYGVK